ncbi:TlpA family protein disulfide reductase [Flavobacterium johnsoniae]|uniref:Thiol-disulfide isomerase or thioredoxin n=1 Tax=Flavobacterium johnsoniae TaxID=986 RepID=A0A1M5VRQ0_FLAJO|nr:TlpA disulfide reductase family protein [Flavobacterium johnsoniae]SHH77870.1 Thiol-disulfide isomerase or thioredoxin [Flavobacterium johnsoniae]
MKMNLKKIAIMPLIAITGWAYASINRNSIDSRVSVNHHRNSEQKLVSNSRQTPDLKLKDENGKTISLKSLKGKVVFINLWATWCPPCIQEMPSINELWKTFKDNKDLVFLMIYVDGKIEKSKEWMKSKKFDLPVYVPDGEIPRELFSGSIPTTIIVDKQNNIITRQVGGADYSSKEVVEMIKKLLSK